MGRNLLKLSKLITVVIIFVLFSGLAWWRWVRSEVRCEVYNSKGTPLSCGIYDAGALRVIGKIHKLYQQDGIEKGTISLSDKFGRVVRVPIIIGGDGKGKLGLEILSNRNLDIGQHNSRFEIINSVDLKNRIGRGAEVVIYLTEERVPDCVKTTRNTLVAYLKSGSIYDYFVFARQGATCPLRIEHISYI